MLKTFCSSFYGAVRHETVAIIFHTYMKKCSFCARYRQIKASSFLQNGKGQINQERDSISFKSFRNFQSPISRLRLDLGPWASKSALRYFCFRFGINGSWLYFAWFWKKLFLKSCARFRIISCIDTILIVITFGFGICCSPAFYF